MIKGRELRTGNLLYYKGTDYIATVALINGENHFDCRDDLGSFTPNGEYDPIPLTEEWLLKLGFKKVNDLSASNCIHKVYNKEYKNRYENFINKSIFDVHLLDDRCICMESKNDSAHVFFVHELQNLYFSYSKEELEVK